MQPFAWDADYSDFAFLDYLESPVETVLTDIGQLANTTTRRVFDWWSRHLASTGMPPLRRDFDILSFVRDAPNLYLAARTADGDWSYRVRGERFLQIFGPSERGTDASRYHYRPFTLSVAEYMDQVSLEGRCRCTRGTLPKTSSRPHRFESLDCPMLNEAGRPEFMIGAAILY